MLIKFMFTYSFHTFSRTREHESLLFQSGVAHNNCYGVVYSPFTACTMAEVLLFKYYYVCFNNNFRAIHLCQNLENILIFVLYMILK